MSTHRTLRLTAAGLDVVFAGRTMRTVYRENGLWFVQQGETVLGRYANKAAAMKAAKL